MFDRVDLSSVPFTIIYVLFFSSFLALVFLGGFLGITIPEKYIFYFMLVLVILFLLVFVYQVFTESGKVSTVKIVTGSDKVNFLGKITSSKFKTKTGMRIKQNLKLYECLDNLDKFYVIEYTNRFLLGFNRSYIKLTPKGLKDINRLIAENNSLITS